MLRIDLVYQQDDAQAQEVRLQLRGALDMLALPPRWEEWTSDDPELPAFAAHPGTCAVYLEGKSVAPAGEIPTRATIFLALQDWVQHR